MIEYNAGAVEVGHALCAAKNTFTKSSIPAYLRCSVRQSFIIIKVGPSLALEYIVVNTTANKVDLEEYTTVVGTNSVA